VVSGTRYVKWSGEQPEVGSLLAVHGKNVVAAGVADGGSGRDHGPRCRRSAMSVLASKRLRLAVRMASDIVVDKIPFHKKTLKYCALGFTWR
jgi:hypothetical protein